MVTKRVCILIYSIGGLLLLFQNLVFAQTSPGKSEFHAQKRVEYIVGNLPIIISAPHGGSLAPQSIPDRSYGTRQTDSQTAVLAKEISHAFFKQTGKYPHVIICHLKRRKVDCNRPIKEGAQGNEEARQVWEAFHQMIEAAQREVVKTSGGGLYIDLHGHAHPAARLELGYLLTNSQLKKSDKDLAHFQKVTSIRSLLKRSDIPFIETLRGKTSFGGLMQQRGYSSIPSPEHPDAGEGKYFSGGYNTRRYCLQGDGKFFGFQLECPYKDVRDTTRNRELFANAFVGATMDYLKIHVPIRPSATGNTSAR